MRQLIENIRAEFGLEAEQHDGSWSVRVPKDGGVVFCVVVPEDTLEWFADAGDAQGGLWSDWGDYYAVEGETEEELRYAMAADIRDFIANALEREIRVLPAAGSKPRGLEWLRDGVWEAPALSET